MRWDFNHWGRRMVYYMAKRYPDFVKKSICKQILEGSSIAYLAKINNIPYSTISTWKSKLLSRGDNMKQKKFSPEEKLEMLFATSSMSEAEISEFCRNRGIYPHMLKTWKKECLKGIASNRRSFDKEKKALVAEVKSLKKEIRRKDKALAEATALLILKKKVQELWGETEDEL